MIAQSNLNAVLTLLSVEPLRDLTTTLRQDPRAFDLILELQRYYRRHLAESHLQTTSAIVSHYDANRLALLDLVVQSTPNGYRSGDARYLIGEIHWRQGDFEAAWQSWQDIVVDPSDVYATAYSEIVQAMRSGNHRLDESSARSINAALGRERSRWRAASFDRLARFGFRFNSY